MRENANALTRVTAMIIAALAVSVLIFSLSGYSVGGVVSNTISGAVTGPGAWQNTFRWFVPLVLLGAGTVISFRAGLYNIGVQGQFYMGAIASFAVAENMPGPSLVVQVAAVLAGMLAGMGWSSIAAILKIAFGTDEALATLMLNFVAIQVLQWVVDSPLKNPVNTSGAAESSLLPAHLRISGTDGVSLSIVIVVAVAIVVMWIVANRTRFGVLATLTGRNAEMVRWQGGNSRRIILGAFAWSGVLAGLAGALDILGPDGQLFPGFAPDVGLTAVTVALVGVLSITGAALAAVFFGALVAATQFLPISTNLPSSAIDLLQGIITLLVTAKLGLLTRKRLTRRSARTRGQTLVTRDEPQLAALNETEGS